MDVMDFDDSMKESLVSSVHYQRRKPLYRYVSVGLGLLCIVLFIANIGQMISYKKHINHMTADPRITGYSELETRLSNLTTDRDHLQQSYNTLRQDRDQLQINMQRNLSNLQRERDGLQRNYSSLRTDKEKLQVGCDDLKRQKEQLQTNHSDLTTDRDNVQRNLSDLQREKSELQTQFDSMKTNRDELQSNYSAVRSEKDQLQTRFNTLQMEKDQLQSNYSALSTAKEQLEKKVKALVQPCPSYWKKSGGSCYYVMITKKTWADSRSECKRKGSDLVIINSPEEQAFVAGLVKEDTWIGLSDRDQEGIWKWVDETVATTTYWEYGQPNSQGGNQDCAEIVRSGEWNDDKCTNKNKSMCELHL